MVNAIFCAHGKLACAMLESVQMVYGDARVEAVEFVPGENAGDIVAKLERLVSIHNHDEWLIAVDLQCGSDACDAQSSSAGNQRPFSAASARTG